MALLSPLPLSRPIDDAERMEHLRAWLHDGMRARRLTQRGLARVAGIDHSTISRLLREDRSPAHRTVVALGLVLGPQPTTPRDGKPEPAEMLQRALRSDPRLTDEQIRRIIEFYWRERGSNDRTPTPTPTELPRLAPMTPTITYSYQRAER
jgi:transcriptional regulator with XRE-family HTH domain